MTTFSRILGSRCSKQVVFDGLCAAPGRARLAGYPLQSWRENLTRWYVCCCENREVGCLLCGTGALTLVLVEQNLVREVQERLVALGFALPSAHLAFCLWWLLGRFVEPISLFFSCFSG